MSTNHGILGYFFPTENPQGGICFPANSLIELYAWYGQWCGASSGHYNVKYCFQNAAIPTTRYLFWDIYLIISNMSWCKLRWTLDSNPNRCGCSPNAASGRSGCSTFRETRLGNRASFGHKLSIPMKDKELENMVKSHWYGYIVGVCMYVY